jgi:ADP-ribosylglycohydrolase
VTTADTRDRAIGALLGLAIGDAVGTTLEFQKRDAEPPLTDMVGGGPFNLAPGEWTDDTSMALCLADSLLAHPELDERDLISRFVRWRRDGENSHNGFCFDIGLATRAALALFERTGNPQAGSISPDSAGNGSLMRLSPVAVRWHRSPTKAREAARRQSATTHAAPEVLDACDYFAGLLVSAIGGTGADRLLLPSTFSGEAAIAAIAAGSWRSKSRGQIHSSGYVVHTLEAAVWAIANGGDFERAVLLAANLADDADTVAAVTGQLGGAVWGASSIPERWRRRVAWADRIVARAEALYELGCQD